MRRTTVLSIVALFVGASLAGSPGVHAGELEPPGPPGPTMKALEQVEPRIAIYADMLPLTISAPGSYYLVEDISTPGAGIFIDSSDVTIDLQGFVLQGGTGHGIYTTAATVHQRVRVHGGSVVDWAGDGIHLYTSYAVVEDVHADGNGGDGIYASYSGTVSRCSASGNGADGIHVGGNSAVYASTADLNDGVGIHAEGGNCLVQDSIATSNRLNGIVAESHSTIRGCVAIDNWRNGIRVDNGCLVVGNQVADNGFNDPVKCGVLVIGTRNRIDGNHLLENNIGVQVDAGDNVILRNTLFGNTTRDVIASGNDVGPWGTAASATSPWANIWKP